MIGFFKKLRKTYVPVINEKPLMMIKCVSCDVERPFTYSASFDHYCPACRYNFNHKMFLIKNGRMEEFIEFEKQLSERKAR